MVSLLYSLILGAMKIARVNSMCSKPSWSTSLISERNSLVFYLFGRSRICHWKEPFLTPGGRISSKVSFIRNVLFEGSTVTIMT